MMESWTSYPKIYALGHAAVADITQGDVYIEEKIDGSQISFGVDDKRVLHIRSKGATICPEAPEKMFAVGVEHVKAIVDRLVSGWTYRGEYLKAQRHNVLQYDRVPKRHIILFDIATGLETYLGQTEKTREANRLGFECVPLISTGRVESIDELKRFLERTSVLGGSLIEGVVLKPVGYDIFGRDGKVLMAKYVSERFKEVHSDAWKKANPGKQDVVRGLIDSLKTEARWEKAVQYLRDADKLQGAPQDIGPLVKRIQQDILDEETEAIKDTLFAWAKQQVCRGVVYGFPEWYKDRLAGQQFEGGDIDD